MSEIILYTRDLGEKSAYAYAENTPAYVSGKAGQNPGISNDPGFGQGQFVPPKDLLKALGATWSGHMLVSQGTPYHGGVCVCE